MTATSNIERTARTRAALVQSARAAFATNGFGATSTPKIAEDAGVSRGALYHHFADKAELFRAVVEHEQAAVATAIERATGSVDDPLLALRIGGETYLETMRDAGRRRILLVDGPAILGNEAMREIDQQHGGRTLAEGIAEAVQAGFLRPLPPAALAGLLSAVFERAAQMDSSDGAYRAALWGLMDGLATEPEH